MSVTAVTYLLCAAAFAFLFLLVVVRRTKSVVGDSFLFASLATVVWAASVSLGTLLPHGVALIAEDVRGLSWLVFLSTLVGAGGQAAGDVLPRRSVSVAIVTVAGLAIGSDLYGIVTASRLSQIEILSRLGIAVLGLFLIENHYRNWPAERRWHIKPLAIALGGLFAFDLYLYSDTLLFRDFNPSLSAARAVANAMVVPLLAVALARNANWRVNIRVSRDAAFHGVTLIASGVFLLSVALVGSLFRRYGGEWSLILQITLLFGSAIVLGMVLSSTSMRVRIRHFVLKNFFPYRYDYRVEWSSFIEVLTSSGAGGDLPERIIRAIARIVSSPGGVLLHRDHDNYVPAAKWNAVIGEGVRERADEEFIRGFRDGQWIQMFSDHSAESSQSGWFEEGSFQLAVPLTHRGELIGFVALMKPVGPVAMDWEVFDLLRIAGRQAASYLAEQEAVQDLADARLLREYSKRFAFVIHDMKNLSSQLGMVVANAQRHGSDPEFLQDAWMTIEDAVDRMKLLMTQLRGEPTEQSPATDVVALLEEVLARNLARERVRIRCSVAETWVRIDRERLRSALTHLIDNAVEASGPVGHVTIGLEADRDEVAVSVSDEGVGMDPEFVREHLFRPFRSSKKGGYGIGAYQTRELIHSAGGQLQVISNPGSGTTMRVVLARAEVPSAQVA
jgi:putative PEP-CTERM system histidine kinase